MNKVVKSEVLPAEIFHPSDYIAEELESRGWTRAMLAFAMDPNNSEFELLQLDLYFTKTHGLLLGDDMAAKLGAAFGTSREIWANLDANWQRLYPLILERDK